MITQQQLTSYLGKSIGQSCPSGVLRDAVAYITELAQTGEPGGWYLAGDSA